MKEEQILIKKFKKTLATLIDNFGKKNNCHIKCHVDIELTINAIKKIKEDV